MSNLPQRIGWAGGLGLFLFGVLFLVSTIVGQGDVKKRIAQRAGQWAELQQLASHTAAGQEAEMLDWLAGQGTAKSLQDWLADEWRGTSPVLVPIIKEEKGSLMLQRAELSFEAIPFVELFEFMERIETMSEPPWRIVELDMEASTPGYGQAKLVLLAVSKE